jgi:hypothetical protein
MSRGFLLLALCALVSALVAPVYADHHGASEEPAAAEALPEVHVYKTPTCGCCGKWVAHLRESGFSVKTTDLRNLDAVKQSNGVPRQLSSCHTAIVGGYVVEGHVPASDVKRMLAEKPAISGLAVPRMPIGSPGMEGPNPERYRVIAFDSNANTSTFATHGP